MQYGQGLLALHALYFFIHISLHRNGDGGNPAEYAGNDGTETFGVPTGMGFIIIGNPQSSFEKNLGMIKILDYTVSKI